MRQFRRSVCLVLCVALILATISASVFAAPVDKKTAANAEMVMKKLEEMQLEPIPKKLAEMLRGKSIWSWLIPRCNPVVTSPPYNTAGTTPLYCQ